MKRKLYFSKSCLIMDIMIQNKEFININLGTLSTLGTVVFTESIDELKGESVEFLDSDYFGEGRFLKNILIKKDVLLNIIKNNISNKDVYIEIIKTINKRN